MRQEAIPSGIEALGRYKTKVTVDFTLAAWNTVANHRLFTVTGVVRAVGLYVVTGSLTSGGAATISFGWTFSNTAYAAAQTFANLTAGNIVNPNGTVTVAALTQAFISTAAYADVISDAQNLGYAIATAALTGGAMDAYCFWTPLSDDGSVAAGTGGAL